MYGTVKQHLEAELQTQSSYLANVVRMQQVVKDLGIEELDAYIDTQVYSFSDDDPPRITITPRHVPGIGLFSDGPGGFDMRVVDSTPILSQIARRILPKVGKLEKGFNEQYNYMTLTAMYNGIKIVIKDETPKTCTVECVEEEIEVPEQLVPAHTKKVVKFRLVGDCDPIFADESSHIVTSQGAIQIEKKEVPF